MNGIRRPIELIALSAMRRAIIFVMLYCMTGHARGRRESVPSESVGCCLLSRALDAHSPARPQLRVHSFQSASRLVLLGKRPRPRDIGASGGRTAKAS